MPFDGREFQASPTPRRETQASLLIGRAMALIPTPQQWSKSAVSTGGRRCVLQALSWDDNYTWSSTGMLALKALHAAASRRGFDRVWRFNDHPSTTHAQVLALMEEARLDAQDAPAHADAGLYEATTGA